MEFFDVEMGKRGKKARDYAGIIAEAVKTGKPVQVTEAGGLKNAPSTVALKPVADAITASGQAVSLKVRGAKPDGVTTRYYVFVMPPVKADASK
jgi:hypothetical protein